MMRLIKRIGRWTVAISVILVGLVLALPLVPGPGAVVILLGLVILLPESRWLRRRYVRLKRKHPRVFHLVEQRRKRRRDRLKRAPGGSRRHRGDVCRSTPVVREPSGLRGQTESRVQHGGLCYRIV